MIIEATSRDRQEPSAPSQSRLVVISSAAYNRRKIYDSQTAAASATPFAIISDEERWAVVEYLNKTRVKLL
jgi:hypothetical protein